MKNATMTDRAPVLAGLPDYQAMFLWDYVSYLDELLSYTLSCAGSIDKDTLYGFTSRIDALRDDLADELPPDPRIRPFKSPAGPRIC